VKIVIVSANFRPHVGGIERFSEVLATGIARRGHDVTVVCCRYGAAPLEEGAGYRVVRIPSSFVLDRRANVPFPVPSPLALRRSLSSALASADVVHVQDVLYATSAPALLAARRRGIAAVVTQHVAFVPQRSRFLDAVEHAALATVGRCGRLANVIATVNPAVADWARQRWPGTDVRVLPVGVPDMASENFDRGSARRSFGLPPDRFLALFVGRDVPKKGLGIFLEAGDPAYDLIAVTDRAGTAEGAKMLPFMPPDRLHALLRCVDAFVLPSEGEGFPVSLQEAFAAGLPVVTTFQPGYDRYVTPDDVLFVDRNAAAVRAAMVRLAGDTALARKLAARSADVADRHFGVGQFVDAYESLYREVLASASAGEAPPGV
jgi:D-inositol-3-phosphate glycosyltransferase